MKTTASYLAIVCCFALGASLACAEPYGEHGQMHGQMGEQMFKVMDTNNNGAITRAEFNAFQARHFKEMDTNGDGKITHAEMEAGHKKAMGNGSGMTHLDERFKAADTNHDGGLGREEAKAMPMLSMYFDEVDTNKDGKVTREEYIAAMPLLHRGKMANPNGKPESL